MRSSSYLVANQSLEQAKNLLTTFWHDYHLSDRSLPVFGDVLDSEIAISLLETLIANDFSILPKIEVRPAKEINYVDGTYAAGANTIYLSQEFVDHNANNISVISEVLLKEIGHFLDWNFNIQDARENEGFVFASLAAEKSPDNDKLAQLKAEDNTATVLQTKFGDNPAFDLIGLTRLRNDPQFAGIDGSGFSVAVIDTGLDANHPLIKPNFVAFYDFSNNSSTPRDTGNHGTHVAGIVGAANANIGVAPDVDLIGLQVFNPVSGGASLNDVEDALEWTLSNREKYNITAVNLSLGSGNFTPDSNLAGDILADDILRLEQAGVTVVAAAGNSYKDNEYPNLAVPAIYSTLAVGSVWQDGTTNSTTWENGAKDFTTGADRIVSQSQRLDAENTIFAPGAFITSTVPGGGLDRQAGTSQAAPHVSGAVALLQEVAWQFGGRLLSPDQVAEILRSTADTIFDGDDENDNVLNTEKSYLRINIYNAAVEVKNRFAGNASSGDDANASNDTITETSIAPNLDNSSISVNGENSNSGSSVYRFFHTDKGFHFYTASVVEKDYVLANLPLYKFEGVSYVSAPEPETDSLTGAKPVYRFFNQKTGVHVYTIFTQEKDYIIANLSDTYIFEDLAYYAYDTQVEGSMPVYRFYHQELNNHFFTSSAKERDYILENLPLYQEEGIEGIGFYVPQNTELFS